MALLVSLRRQSQEHELGSYPALVLRYAELRSENDEAIIKHLNNRWYAESGEEFSTLDVIGPLVIKGSDGRTLGPYTKLSMFDGVAYVDGRVFAFTDVQREDWYMHDAGAHWAEMRIVFSPTGP